MGEESLVHLEALREALASLMERVRATFREGQTRMNLMDEGDEYGSVFDLFEHHIMPAVGSLEACLRDQPGLDMTTTVEGRKQIVGVLSGRTLRMEGASVMVLDEVVLQQTGSLDFVGTVGYGHTVPGELVPDWSQSDAREPTPDVVGAAWRRILEAEMGDAGLAFVEVASPVLREQVRTKPCWLRAFDALIV